MRYSRVLVLALLALLGATCARTPIPNVATTAAILSRDVKWLNDSTPIVRFQTPYIYGFWRLQVEACSGRTREGWPTFYVAPVSPLLLGGRVTADGVYIKESNSIVFALGQETSRITVSHELLHWLIDDLVAAKPDSETFTEQQARTHPSEYFERRCGLLLRAQ